MDLSVARSHFATTPLLALSPAGEWVETGYFGSLQVYDRFISERSFGQKKRIFTTDNRQVMDPSFTQFRVGNSEATVYLIEWANEDTFMGSTFGQTLSLREASVHGKIIKPMIGPVRGSGIATETTPTLLATVWADLEFYKDDKSSEFAETRYIVATLVLPLRTPVDSDCFFVQDNGTQWKVNEVFNILELPAARVQRVG